MRHSKIGCAVGNAAQNGVSTVLRLEPPGDRTIAISAAQAAIAATDNVLTGSVNSGRIAAMAVNFIEALAGEKPNRLPASIEAISNRSLRDHFEGGLYEPHRTIRDNVCHKTYINHLLSPSGNETLRETLSATISGNFIGAHVNDLDTLRTLSPSKSDPVYKLIIRGNFQAALIRARNGKLDPHQTALICGIVGNHARCFAIKTAHQKVAVLRDHAIAPSGDRFAGFKQWPSIGHICLATVAGPAQIIQRLATEVAAGRFVDMDDDAIVEYLVKEGWLGQDAAGSAIMDIAHMVRRTLKSRRQGKGSYDFTAALNYVARGCSLAAQLNRGAMRRDKISKLEPAEYRLGLSGSEGAAFVALELLRAFAQIDLCIEAILANKPLPPPTPISIAKKRLAFTSVLLRSEGQPDRNATKIDLNPDIVWHDLDKRRGSGRIPMASMLEKLHNGVIQDHAWKLLGIDARHWFLR